MLIKTLNILHKVKTIRDYHQGSLIDSYNDLQEIIYSLFKKFEKIVAEFNNNKALQIRRDAKTMRLHLKRLSDMIKITNKE